MTNFSMMRHSILIIATLLWGTWCVRAQKNELPFVKGTRTIGVSTGFGIDYGYYGNVSRTPALCATYDQGFFEEVGPGTIGFGGIVGFKAAHYNYANNTDQAKWLHVLIGVRATYHLTLLANKDNKFDPYGGVLAGIRINQYSDTYYNRLGFNPNTYNGINPITGIFVGARYNFANNIGAFAEAGYDISFLRIGLHYNF